MFNRPIALAIGGFVALVLLLSTVVIVPETSQAVIVRFGQPIDTYNRYQDNQDFGRTGAGIIARIPFIDQIIWVDKRVQSVEMERQQVLSTDRLRLEVDAFARFRVVDPQRMYVSVGSEERLAEELRPILGSTLRNELGKRPFAVLLSPDRGAVMQRIALALDETAQQYGARIIDVQIKRADLPEGAPLRSAYQRMRSEREEVSRTTRAEGQRDAAIIRAEADATAARTYADSFGQDPQFYEFYRAMQAYDRTFVQSNSDTSIILSPENEFLRQFQGGRR